MKYFISATAFLFLFALCADYGAAASFCAQGGQCSPVSSKFLAEATAVKSKNSKLPSAKAEQEQKITYTIYYFHGNKRCATCKRIEAQAKALTESAFAGKIKDGTLKFISVNTDEEQNKHFIKDFNLVSSGVEIARTNAKGITDKHRALPKVWPLAYREQEFNDYLTKEINAFLAEIL